MKHSLLISVLLMVLAVLFAATVFLAEPLEKTGDRYLHDTLKKAVKLVDHILDLIVVFLIQTIVLPILIVWLFVKLITRLLLSREPWPFEQAFDVGP